MNVQWGQQSEARFCAFRQEAHMTPTKLLVGQIFVVFAIVILGLWAATQWAASMLGYQAQLGAPWTIAFDPPIYRPWQLFRWVYQYAAYGLGEFEKASTMASGRRFS